MHRVSVVITEDGRLALQLIEEELQATEKINDVSPGLSPTIANPGVIVIDLNDDTLDSYTTVIEN